MNTIIWAYDFGGRSKNMWPKKHDCILWYVKDPKNYTFNYDQIERVPYRAPGLCGPEKAAKGKNLVDWWTDPPDGDFWVNTIVPTSGKERTGYADQKPLKILERIVKVHSNPDDWLVDPFAGSGSFGEAARKHNRNCVLIDNNDDAIKCMHERFKSHWKKE